MTMFKRVQFLFCTAGQMPSASQVEPENVIRQTLDLSSQSDSPLDLLRRLRNIALSNDWSLVESSPLELTKSIGHHQATTKVDVLCDGNCTIVAETIFVPLNSQNFGPKDFVFLAFLGLMVFLLPEGFLGLIMLAGVIYVAAPVLHRNFTTRRQVRKLALAILTETPRESAQS